MRRRKPIKETVNLGEPTRQTTLPGLGNQRMPKPRDDDDPDPLLAAVRNATEELELTHEDLLDEPIRRPPRRRRPR